MKQRDKVDYIAFSLNNGEASIGTNNHTDIVLGATTTEEIKDNSSLLAPLSPYHSRFEELVYNNIASQQSEIETIIEWQNSGKIAEFECVRSKQKTAILKHPDFPTLVFHLRVENSNLGKIDYFKAGTKVEARILECTPSSCYVDITDQLETTSTTIEDLATQIDQRFKVIIKNVNPKFGVFVRYNEIDALIPRMNLHFSDGVNLSYYEERIGQNMMAYLMSINPTNNKVVFSENSLRADYKPSNPTDIDANIAIGETAMATPIYCHQSNGIYLECNNRRILIKKSLIPQDIWDNFLDRYTLGEQYPFRVEAINGTKITLQIPEIAPIVTNEEVVEVSQPNKYADLIDTKVNVTIKGTLPLNRVIVEYDGVTGSIIAKNLLYADGNDITHYDSLIGSTISAYLVSIDKRQNLYFSENSINQIPNTNQDAITAKTGDIITGVPVAFNSKFGIFVRYDNRNCLINRAHISDELWESAPRRYTLGKEYKFVVSGVKQKKGQIFLQEFDKDVNIAKYRDIADLVCDKLKVGERVEAKVVEISNSSELIMECNGVRGVLDCSIAPSVAPILQEQNATLNVDVSEKYGCYQFNMISNAYEVDSTLSMTILNTSESGDILLTNGEVFAVASPWRKRILKTDNFLEHYTPGKVIDVKVRKHEPSYANIIVSLTTLTEDCYHEISLGKAVEVEIIRQDINEYYASNGGEIEYKVIPYLTNPDHLLIGSKISAKIVYCDIYARTVYIAEDDSRLLRQEDIAMLEGKSVDVNIEYFLGPNITLASFNDKLSILFVNSAQPTLQFINAKFNGEPFTVAASAIVDSDYVFALFSYDDSAIGNKMAKTIAIGQEGYANFVQKIDGHNYFDFYGIKGVIFKKTDECNQDITNGSHKVAFMQYNTKDEIIWFKRVIDNSTIWDKADIKVGDDIQVKIVSSNDEYVEVEHKQIKTTCPISEWTLSVLDQDISYKGSTIWVRVTEFNPEEHILGISRRQYLLEQWQSVPIPNGTPTNLTITKILDNGSVIVTNDNYLGIIEESFLTWNRVDLFTKTLKVGYGIDAVAIDIQGEPNYVVKYMRKYIEPNAWLTFTQKVGDIATATVVTRLPDSLIIEVDGVLTTLSNSDLCWIGGLTNEVPNYNTSLQKSNNVKVKIDSIDAATSTLVVSPAAPEPLYSIGSTYNMEVASFDGDSIIMQTYFKREYTLRAEDITANHLYPIDKLYRIGESFDVKVIDENHVSLKELRESTTNDTVIGSLIEATVIGEVDNALVVEYNNNRIRIESPHALRISEEYIPQIDLNRVFAPLTNITLRAIDLSQSSGALDFAIEPTQYDPQQRSYEVVERIDSLSKYIVKGANGWGVATISSEEVTIGETYTLGVENISAEGWLELTDQLQNAPVELLGQELSLVAEAMNNDYVQMSSEEYNYLDIRLPLGELNWTSIAQSNIIERRVRAKVIAIDNKNSSIYVSAKILKQDTRALRAIPNKGECLVEITGCDKDKKEYLVKGNNFEGVIPFDSLSWIAYTYPHDRFSIGDSVKVVKLDNNKFSIKENIPNCWDIQLRNWKEGDIHKLSVSHVSENNLYLQSQHTIFQICRSRIPEIKGALLTNMFQIGEMLKVRVDAIDHAKESISLSLCDISYKRYGDLSSSLSVGTIVEGEVNYIHPKYMFINAGQYSIKVNAVDVDWNFSGIQPIPYNIGDKVRCVITAVSDDNVRILASVKDMLPKPDLTELAGKTLTAMIDYVTDDQIGLIYNQYRGYIKISDTKLSPQRCKTVFRVNTLLDITFKGVDNKANLLIFESAEGYEPIKVDDCGLATITNVESQVITIFYKGYNCKIDTSKIPWIHSNADKIYSIGDRVHITIKSINPKKTYIFVRLDNSWKLCTAKVGGVILATIYKIDTQFIYIRYQNIYGKIPQSEISWYKNIRATDIYSKCSQIECVVTEFKAKNQLLTASIKANTTDPFQNIALSLKDVVEAEVRAISDNGLVVRYEGLWGCIPLNDCAWFKIADLGSLYSVGDKVQCAVSLIDIDKRIIEFSIRETLDDPMSGINYGDIVNCTITEVNQSGLECVCNGKIGFIPAIECSWQEYSRQTTSQVESLFSVGMQIDAKVISIDREQKICNLSIKDLHKNPSLNYTHNDITKATILELHKQHYIVSLDNCIAKLEYKNTLYGSNVNLRYIVGEQVDVRICGINHATSAIDCFAIDIQDIKEAMESINPGDILQGTIIEQSYKGVLMSINDSKIRVFIPVQKAYSNYNQLSESPYKTGDSLSVTVENVYVKGISAKVADNKESVTSRYQVGDDCTVTALVEFAQGVVSYDQDGVWYLTKPENISYKSAYIPFQKRKKIERGSQHRARVIDITEENNILLDFKVHLKHPNEIYKVGDVIKGVVYNFVKPYFFVELEHANASIHSSLLSWTTIEKWYDLLKIDEEYELIVRGFSEDTVALSNLKVPFDKNNRATAKVTHFDANNVYLECDGIPMQASVNDRFLVEKYYSSQGWLDIPEGTLLKVEKKSICLRPKERKIVVNIIGQ